jgi:hypothetical protein
VILVVVMVKTNVLIAMDLEEKIVMTVVEEVNILVMSVSDFEKKT